MFSASFSLYKLYMTAPYCKKGSRRCPVSKKCVKKTGSRKSPCPKGTRKCANGKCYKKNKSSKSRRRFHAKYH